MIEIKNISKTYRTKKGLEVAALKDVSLNFPDKGMVFVLGKSGSGKSTLLNVMGGLDSYDNGELIIKGKSSKDFSQADFDSYRNTLIGFIFQEYNILDEFTIGANIALALQLQGKKADTDTVNNILDEVDLTGFGNRKPNELSGGQKQRVAIARALIKKPDIIMADEPTGALDSNTGRQVFDTLKKLSKDKLVIIVSHDREFAEYYGDRVIEFKDGEVISDISKYEAPAIEKSEGLKIIDNRIMQVKKGYKLSAKDIETITNYLENSETDTFMSLDSRTNESLKQIAMISDDGSKQSFKDTDNEEVAANAKRDGYKMIRSRLPFKHSLKIGLSSLRAKPVKLIFTIILSMVAFGLFGMADTFASFNSTTSLVSSLMDNKQEHVSIGRSMYSYSSDGYMTGEFINRINKETEINAKGVYPGEPGYDDLNLGNNYKDRYNGNSNYYINILTGLMELLPADFDERNITIIGNTANAVDEIVITKYLFENIQKFGYAGYNFEGDSISIDSTKIGDESNFLSKNIKIDLNGKQYKLVGIADTNFNTEKYKILKDDTLRPEYGNDEYKLIDNLESEIKYGYHALGFVYPGTISGIKGNNFGNRIDPHSQVDITNIDSSKIATFQMLKDSNQRFVTKSGITSTSDDQIMLSSNSLMRHLSNKNIDFPRSYDELKEQFLEGAYNKHLEVSYYALYMDNNGNGYDERGTKKIVGFYDCDNDSSAIIVGDGFYEQFAKNSSGIYSYAIGIMPKSRTDIQALVKMADTEDVNKRFYILSKSTITISQFGESIEDVAKIFIYIGIGFSLFAALMLMNYIATSISYKKREIGILRAVGARGSDVFGIFCCESMFVAIINFILSVVATIGICIGINAIIRDTLGMPITLLTVGLRQVALILGVSILTALLASLIPVLKISRKRPIDAIRNK